MSVFEELAKKDHEQVIFLHDAESGLKAIIAIHDTTLGPSLGGCRMWQYENEELALRDVLRLSRGMTYKSAAAGLNLGGGKAVIIGNPKVDKSETLFRAYGRFVQGLAGRYITAEDVGTTVREMEWVRMETDYVCGISRALGGSGDPSPVTALGCYEGIKASIKWQTGSESLEGKRVAVQGVGAVGYHLVQHLARDGAKVIVTDIDQENLKRISADFRSVEVVAPDKIYGVECDVFAPCALGAIINDDTIPQLRCGIIAGSSNNQLADEDRHAAGRDLDGRGHDRLGLIVVEGRRLAGGAERNEAAYAFADEVLDQAAIAGEIDIAVDERRDQRNPDARESLHRSSP